MNPFHRTPKKCKTSKRISKLPLKLRKLRIEAKKNMSNILKTMFFVHWALFGCNGDLLLIEP